MQDELIIKYIKKKKEVGMELLIDNYRGILTSVVRKHLGVLINYEEECIDDVLLSIWDNIKSFDKNKNQFKNWICAIAKYKAIDYKRKYLAKVETLDMTDEIYYIDKDKYRILNDVKVNIDEYEEVKFDNNDNIKQRMKKKLRNRKPSYRNAIAVASAVILGSSVMLNENVWAHVQSIWYTIDEVFSLKKEEVKDYTYNIDKTVEDKNIKILFKSIMLDDGKLIIDANIDDTKFNPFEDLTQKQQKDWSVDKWGNKETLK